MTIVSFLDLEVYQESFQLSLEIDRLARIFPRSERFLLSDQMIRASRAIPAIIAEGYGKHESAKEFKKYLRDALGETNEMINHLALAKILIHPLTSLSNFQHLTFNIKRIF